MFYTLQCMYNKVFNRFYLPLFSAKANKIMRVKHVSNWSNYPYKKHRSKSNIRKLDIYYIAVSRFSCSSTWTNEKETFKLKQNFNFPSLFRTDRCFNVVFENSSSDFLTALKRTNSIVTLIHSPVASAAVIQSALITIRNKFKLNYEQTICTTYIIESRRKLFRNKISCHKWTKLRLIIINLSLRSFTLLGEVYPLRYKFVIDTASFKFW